MNELSKAKLQRAELQEFNRLRFEQIDRGRIVLPWLLRPCKMKILMVVDGDDVGPVTISYGSLYFSLSTLIDTLENDPDWWVEYEVTKTHRQIDPLGAADMDGFRFNQAGFDINDYDQVWFFGARQNESDSQALDDDELEIIARWMDERQGGVFACGDHDDLGASLCSRIPRVRSMRKWTPAQGVPQNFGLDRHDTLLKGHDAFYTFNDESDDIPMRTRLRRYPYWSWSPFNLRWSPHPVLCGTQGPIDVLPDHPHEGEVIEPVSVTDTFTFNGYTADEYPEVSGQRETPDIIAWASVQGDHTEGRNGQPGTDQNKGPANAKEFGAVGAYDGHEANVGRVVVDSTWHHWMDINLVGRPPAPIDFVDPVAAGDPKRDGFNHSAAGQAELARIKEYFLNTAKWLGAPAKQNCMLMRATWGIIIRYPLSEKLKPTLPIWELGMVARDAIGRRAGQCTMRSWLLPWFPHWKKHMFIDPKVMEKIRAPIARPNWDAFETYVMGGMTRELLKLGHDMSTKPDKLSEKKVADCVAKGLKIGAEEFAADFEGSMKEGEELLKMARELPSLKIADRDFLDS